MDKVKKRKEKCEKGMYGDLAKVVAGLVIIWGSGEVSRCTDIIPPLYLPLVYALLLLGGAVLAVKGAQGLMKELE